MRSSRPTCFALRDARFAIASTPASRSKRAAAFAKLVSATSSASAHSAGGGAAPRPAPLLNALGGRAEAMAAKYVWWQEPRRTLSSPSLLVAQVMNLGTLEDVQWLLGRVCEDTLRRTLREAPAGIFNNRSWCFWHLRLGIRPTPPLPERPLP